MYIFAAEGRAISEILLFTIMKGNPFFATMRGKLGEQVFMRTGGEQRARTYLKVISNPRTKAQMSQRVKLANLVNFYRILRPLLGDSFLRRPTNLSSYNAFVKANLASSRVYLTKEQASSGYVVTAPYTITDGTLQQSGWGKVAGGFDFTSYVTPFEGTAGVGYALQEGFKNAYLAYYPDADESDVLLFVSVMEQPNAKAPIMSIHPMYLSQLDGTDSWFAKHIMSDKPAEPTSPAQYLYKAPANESLAIVRARISNNRIVVCSTESLYLGVSANLRQGQFDTQMALNSAINSYGIGSGFAIQEAVRNTPSRLGVQARWVLENGNLADSVTFNKPADVSSTTAIIYLTGLGIPAKGYGKTELRFEDNEMNGEGTKIVINSREYGKDYTTMTLRLESAAVTGGFNNYPVTTRILIKFYDKDDENKVVFSDYSAPLTFNAKE